jgi:DNA-binding transcriptional LysR family regulator
MLIEEAVPGCTARRLVELADIARDAVGEEFLEFIRTCPTWHMEGNILFIHAGLDPTAEPSKFLNQIGQIPSPVAKGIGYTLLPRSGIEAFSERDRLKVVALPHRRYHDLWSIIQRGHEPTARLRTIMQVAHDVAGEIG